jgi:hypothetical protein
VLVNVAVGGDVLVGVRVGAAGVFTIEVNAAAASNKATALAASRQPEKNILNLFMFAPMRSED